MQPNVLAQHMDARYGDDVAELTLTSKDPVKLKVDALVVGVVSSKTGITILNPDALPEDLRSAITSAASGLDITGVAGQVRRMPSVKAIAAPVVALVGLGEAAAEFSSEALRRAAGSATRELSGVANIAIALPAPDVDSIAAIAEGALFGAYDYSRYRTSEGKNAVATSAITVVSPLARSKEAAAAVARATVLAEAVHNTRDLVNAAPNDLFPEAFADIAKSAVKGTGVKVTVLDEKALQAGGYGGLINVGKGSSRGPRLVKISYTPSRPNSRVALVGKGITFDSGGISIKPAKGMEAMKSDMAGAAAVLSTVVAAARLEIPVAVTGYLCLAENMPSGTAQRPSDVITVRGGKTVEVLNTDAEGRLVLADGLVSALEESPDLVVDIATLTGAQLVALGERVSAIMGTDDAREELVSAADTSGEQFWPMPLPEELRAGLNSKVADIANIGDRFGGMLAAGVFLQEFVGSTPWAHLDIAGPAFNESSPYGYTGAGGTGVGVRTMLALLEGRASKA